MAKLKLGSKAFVGNVTMPNLGKVHLMLSLTVIGDITQNLPLFCALGKNGHGLYTVVLAGVAGQQFQRSC